MQTREKTLYVDAGTFASALRAVVESGVHEGAERVTLERRPGDVQRFRMTVVEPEPQVTEGPRRASRSEVLAYEYEKLQEQESELSEKLKRIQLRLLEVAEERSKLWHSKVSS